MKQIAISVKQPWAYLLCAGIKPVENRTWPLPAKYKGERVFIHASAKPDKEPYMLFTNDQATVIDHRIMDVIESYHTGSAIIGSVCFVDCVINHPSVWAEKTRIVSGIFYDDTIYSKGWAMDSNVNLVLKEDIIYNWVVAEPILFDEPILNVKGKLSFWDCSEYIKNQVI